MDLEKAMQFMLDMQAKHEAWLHAHNQAVVRLDEQIARVEKIAESNATRIGQLMDVSSSLAHHGEETDRRFDETNQKIRGLADAQSRTDEKPNALVDMVDKLVKRNSSALSNRPLCEAVSIW